MERRIVRKIDLHILPFICISYLINYLDRVNLGNARTLNNDIPADNLVNQLDLTGNRYNIAVAVFFVPYVLFEAPSNFAMKYFSPSIWIGRIMISYRSCVQLRGAPGHSFLLGDRRSRLLPWCCHVPLLLVQTIRTSHSPCHLRRIGRCGRSILWTPCIWHFLPQRQSQPCRLAMAVYPYGYSGCSLWHRRLDLDARLS
jgi:hypothetical protein